MLYWVSGESEYRIWIGRTRGWISEICGTHIVAVLVVVFFVFLLSFRHVCLQAISLLSLSATVVVVYGQVFY